MFSEPKHELNIFIVLILINSLNLHSSSRGNPNRFSVKEYETQAFTLKVFITNIYIYIDIYIYIESIASSKNSYIISKWLGQD